MATDIVEEGDPETMGREAEANSVSRSRSKAWKGEGAGNRRRLLRAAGLALLLSAAFHGSGWFFDRDGHGFVALLIACGLVSVWGKGRGELWPDRGWKGRRLLVASTCCIGLALLYAMRAFGSPVSVPGNAEEALRWLAYSSLALLLAAWQRQESADWAAERTASTPSSGVSSALHAGAPTAVPCDTASFGATTAVPCGTASFGATTAVPCGTASFGATTAVPCGTASFGALTAVPCGTASFGATTAVPCGTASFGAPMAVMDAARAPLPLASTSAPAAAWALQSFAGFFAASSLAAWFGWIVGPDFVLRTVDGRLSATGARLAGYLQYSNTLGAFAAALLAWQWLVLARSGSPRLRLSAAWLAAPCLAVLLLSESRGATLALLLTAAAGLLLARVPERRRWCGAAWRSMPGTAAIVAVARFREQAAEAALAQDGAVLLALVAACAASAVWITAPSGGTRHAERPNPAPAIAAPRRLRLNPALASLDSRRLRRLIRLDARTAAVLLLGAAAALRLRLDGGWDRFDPAEPASAATGAARLLLYRDGWAAARESWLVGYGARAWELLRGSFQSAPYAAGEVHSGYLDMLLTAGAPGLALLLALGAALLAAAGAEGALGAVPAATLLLHAAIDVDMCYGAYWLLLLVLSAACASLAPPRLTASPSVSLLPPASASLYPPRPEEESPGPGGRGT
ncbi:hypothetical protein HGI30_18560 [Paenibacillus albicereus]|uniref:O-antigen ligase domain-containing protein n=1 Tax=Paenibacillus albicereus TaxID=2726185 RepID=A0A6H2H114_9BACL|nr:O-antigen ligase family protein [Paenibacillus albicereus]QJC53374.1 hypothetical protein HGI30_18560 [Paenibacillus albicereus]